MASLENNSGRNSFISSSNNKSVNHNVGGSLLTETSPIEGASRLDKKVSYELNIACVPFKLRSSHDEETVKELVELVDRKIQQALSASKSGSFQSAALLAALNLAEELILLKRKAFREISKLEDRAMKISQDLENSKIQVPNTKSQGL